MILAERGRGRKTLYSELEKRPLCLRFQKKGPLFNERIWIWKKQKHHHILVMFSVFGDQNYWHPVTMRFPVCFKKFF